MSDSDDDPRRQHEVIALVEGAYDRGYRRGVETCALAAIAAAFAGAVVLVIALLLTGRLG